MTAPHTPGPWVEDDFGCSGAHHCGENPPPEDWTCVGIEDDSGFAEVIAYCHPDNAPLIALAPELAAALRETVAALEAAGADGEPGEMPSPALDRARLLLARLDGAA